LTVCQGPNCGGNGATFTLRDIEDLSYGLATTEVTGCLGHCERGPNCSVSEGPGARGKVTNKINKFSKVVELLEKAIPGYTLDDVQKKVSKLKYNARRDDNPAERKKMVEEAMGILDKNPKAADQHPELLAQVLTMRARETMKASPADAYRDMMKAIELTPDWAYGQATWSAVLEAVNMPNKALAAMQAAIKIEKGIDKSQLKRQVQRLERRATETPEDAEPPAAGDAAAPKAAEEAAEDKPKAKKPKAKAKSPKDTKDSSSKKKKDETPAKVVEAAPAPVEEEEDAEIKEWDIKEVKKLNHDCISMQLKCPGRLPKDFTDECWHVDLAADIGDMFEEVRRSYTPASGLPELLKGDLELMIKIYDGGKLTSHLKTLKAGDKVLVTKPHITLEPNEYPDGMVMVAGGSAVTIALQACQSVLARTKKPVHLFLCNKTAEDVLYQDRFEAMLQANPSFHVTHCLSQGKPPAAAAKQRAKWHSGRLQRSLVDSVPMTLKAVISGPRGLCRTAYDIFLAQGRKEDQIRCLDDLPDPEETPAAAPAAAPAEAPPLKEAPPPKVEETTDSQGWFAKLFFGCSGKCQGSEKGADEVHDDVRMT